MQGLAFGAEWGGAILMCFEHAPWRKKGLYTGITQAGFPVGLLLANLAFLVSVPLGEQWAWRVPFLLSAVLIAVGIVIRLKVEESPEFEELKAEGEVSKNPLKEVIRDDWRNILRAFCLRIAETAGYAVSVTFMLSYISEEKLAGRPVTLTATMIAAAIGIFATTYFGAWTDRIGRRPVYILGTAIMIAWGIPLFLVINTGSAVLIVIAFVISYSVCQNSLAGVQGAWFSELFNAKTRTTGASLAYQFSAVVSGFTPLVATALYISTGWIGPAILFSFYGLLGLVAALMTRETWGRAEREEVEALERAVQGRGHRAGPAPQLRVGQRELIPMSTTNRTTRTTSRTTTDTTGEPDDLTEHDTDRDGGRPRDRADRIERLRARRVPDPTERAEHGRGAGPGLHRAGARRRRRPRRGLHRPAPVPAGRPALGRPRPVPALHRPLRHRALRGAGRGRDHPGRGAGDLRLRRVPAADVGHGVLHPGHGDLRRVARPRPGRRHRHGAGAAPPGQPRPGLQPAVRRRARRGLDVGGGDADRPPRAWTTSPRSSTSTPCRPTGPPSACCAPSRSPTSGRRSAGTPCGSTATTSSALVDAFDELRAHRGSPGVLICDTRIGRGVPLLETREKAHFMRVSADEWQTARDQLAEGHKTEGQNR